MKQSLMILIISCCSLSYASNNNRSKVDDQFLPYSVVQCKNEKGEYINKFRYETHEEYEERINRNKD